MFFFIFNNKICIFYDFLKLKKSYQEIHRTLFPWLLRGRNKESKEDGGNLYYSPSLPGTLYPGEGGIYKRFPSYALPLMAVPKQFLHQPKIKFFKYSTTIHTEGWPQKQGLEIFKPFNRCVKYLKISLLAYAGQYCSRNKKNAWHQIEDS